MPEYSYQNLGATWAVAIKGDSEQEINEHHYGFWNHGATTGELIWLNEGRLAYFYTTPQDLTRALLSMSVMSILAAADKKGHNELTGDEPEIRAKAEIQAKERLAQIKQDYFVLPEPEVNHHFNVAKPNREARYE